MSSVITKRFDEVFDLYLGRTPSRGDKAYWGGDNTWVSIADMSCGKYISSSKENITDEAVKETGIPIVRKGTVIMSFKLSIGKVCITDTDLYTNEAIMAFVPKSDFNILTDYLYYYLMAYKWKCSNEVVLGFTLNKKTISASMITIPTDIAEQQRIVDILDEAFEKIDALKANAEQNLRDAKALFQSSVQEVFSEHPEWKWDTIGNVCKTGAGGTPAKIHKDYYEGGTIPWLRSGEVCQRYIYETEMFITQMGFENSSAHWFPENTVLVAMYGATAGQVGILKIRATTNQAVCGIFPNEEIVPEFLYYALLHAQKGLVAKATGNAQPNISQIKVKGTSIPIISIGEQKDIIARLDDLNDRCKVLQTNYDKTLTLCDDLKQALLRKAFNGEL